MICIYSTVTCFCLPNSGIVGNIGGLEGILLNELLVLLSVSSVYFLTFTLYPQKCEYFKRKNSSKLYLPIVQDTYTIWVSLYLRPFPNIPFPKFCLLCILIFALESQENHLVKVESSLEEDNKLVLQRSEPSYKELRGKWNSRILTICVQSHFPSGEDLQPIKRIFKRAAQTCSPCLVHYQKISYWKYAYLQSHPSEANSGLMYPSWCLQP